MKKVESLSVYNHQIPGLLILLFSSIFFSSTNAQNKIQRSGDVLALAIPLTSFATPYFLKDTSGFVECLESFACDISITYALKYIVGETRPDKSDKRSFPSGHTSASFAGASFIQRRYGWKYSVPLYCAAAYTGFTRYFSNKHYIHDVIAGASVGILSSCIFTNKRIKIAPVAQNNFYGVIIKL